jgi:hypothetical protein
MKKAISFLLVILIFCNTGLSSGVNYMSDSMTDKLILHSEIIDNKIYVPIQELATFFNATINTINNATTVKYGDYYSTFEIDKPTLKLNYNTLTLSESPKMINDNIYIPLQYIIEIFGVEPEYDMMKNQIYVTQTHLKINDKVLIDGYEIYQFPYNIKVDSNYSVGSLLADHIGYPLEMIKTLDQKYVIKDTYKKSEISYYYWLVDLHNICLYATTYNKIDEVKPQIEHMADYINQFIIERNGSYYVEYPFENIIYNQDHKEGYVSAFGNAMIMWGFVRAYETTGLLKYKMKADKLAKSFLDIRDHKNQTEPWVSFVDDNQFLWFEEAPYNTEPQTRILNGDITCIEALYTYYLCNPKPEILELIKAAITTIQCNIERYRIPNKIHAYGLYDLSSPDYGQYRNLNQLENLYNLTGEQYFLFMRSNFDNDYRRSGEDLQ